MRCESEMRWPLMVERESCTLWRSPGAVTVCFLAEKLPSCWDPPPRPRPSSLGWHGFTASWTTSVGPGFGCPDYHRQALSPSFGGLHIDTAKDLVI